MLKRLILPMVSIAAISMPSLALVSCSNPPKITISKISIDRNLLLQNFSQNVDDPNSWSKESIKLFIKSFNENPQSYLINSVEPPVAQASPKAIVPFITTNIDHFATTPTSAAGVSKISLSVSLASVNQLLPSFDSIKFQLNLKTEYKPNIIIDNELPLEKNIFSLQIRTATPTDPVIIDQEVQWIRDFLLGGSENKPSSNVEWMNNKIKKESLAKKAPDFASEIINKAAFEKTFKLTVPFPTQSSGWDYEVLASIPPNTSGTVQLNITFSNKLFPSLQPNQSEGIILIKGFSEK